MQATETSPRSKPIEKHHIVSFPETQSAAAAIRNANLEWGVDLTPLSYGHAYGEPRPTGHFAVTRGDTEDLLGVVGSRYTPVQQSDLATLVDEALNYTLGCRNTSTEATQGRGVTAAGYFNLGKLVFLSVDLGTLKARYPDGTTDYRTAHALIVNTHDGSSTLRVVPWERRVYCANQESAMKSAKALFVKHHTGGGSLHDDIVALGDCLGDSWHVLAERVQQDERLMRERLRSARTERDVLDSLYREWYARSLPPLPQDASEEAALKRGRREARRKTQVDAALAAFHDPLVNRHSRPSMFEVLQAITALGTHGPTLEDIDSGTGHDGGRWKSVLLGRGAAFADFSRRYLLSLCCEN